MNQTLEKLGLSPKESKVYLVLLGLDPSPLRKVAEEVDMNRGSTYDALKSLMKRGLVSFYDKERKQHFVAEDPDNLVGILREKRRAVVKAKKDLERSMPELRALYAKTGEKPSVKMYEDMGGAKAIFEDILRTMSEEEIKTYYVFSSFTREIRELLYRDIESFSERRIKLGIKVNVIGPPGGGELRGLDERRSLPKLEKAPSYILIYGPKVAILSFSKDNSLIAVLINSLDLANTQRLVFETLWKTLPEKVSK